MAPPARGRATRAEQGAGTNSPTPGVACVAREEPTQTANSWSDHGMGQKLGSPRMSTDLHAGDNPVSPQGRERVCVTFAARVFCAFHTVPAPSFSADPCRRMFAIPRFACRHSCDTVPAPVRLCATWKNIAALVAVRTPRHMPPEPALLQVGTPSRGAPCARSPRQYVVGKTGTTQPPRA